MNKVLLVLCVFIVGLQYRLWVGDGSIAHLVKLKRDIDVQQQEVDSLTEKNRVLLAEVIALKRGNDMIEEKARTQLGMIKEGETFFMFAN